MKKVLIGMSGGVDSSVAAAILKEQGYTVIGATMHLWSEEIAEDAARVCRHLGIEHRVLDFHSLFCGRVVDYFTEEYKNGRTPNPCVQCNKHLKFGAMLDYALENGIDYIATGHYARICKNGNGKYTLNKSDAAKKDQSYFLYTLTQRELSRTLMPLGEYHKDEVRGMARSLGLPVAEKPDSQEICFVENDNYPEFICTHCGYTPMPGDILDIDGNVIGEHRGLIYYTIGQRKGIGAYGRPMFVMQINPKNNTIVLGEKGMEFSSSFTGTDLTLMSGDSLTAAVKADVKIRFQAKPVRAKIIPTGNNSVEVIFDTPQRAVTPGQAAVFYNDSEVLGGCTVDEIKA